jgi:hypothetical protein
LFAEVVGEAGVGYRRSVLFVAVEGRARGERVVRLIMSGMGDGSWFNAGLSISSTSIGLGGKTLVPTPLSLLFLPPSSFHFLLSFRYLSAIISTILILRTFSFLLFFLVTNIQVDRTLPPASSSQFDDLA